MHTRMGVMTVIIAYFAVLYGISRLTRGKADNGLEQISTQKMMYHNDTAFTFI
ncbi:MAG: hypothetical protein J6S52_03905 [Prevotella sp.]|nr:hypothetical protein [Prevotella sp.]